MEIDPRLEQVVGRMVRALREGLSELRVTEAELMQGLEFLTDVGKHDEFVLLSDVLGVSVLVDEITHGEEEGGTATNVLGPFYLPDAPTLPPPFALAGEDEPGETLIVSGAVTDADTGRSLPGAVLDVWQAGADGRYSTQDPDRGEFRLRGRIPVGADGRYEFRTVVPPPYEIPKDGPVGALLRTLGRHAFRPAHLHLKASRDGYRALTTMVFVDGDPYLGSDAIGAVKDSLVVRLERHGSEAGMRARGVDRPFATCRFDLALRPA
ncbi:MAG: 6-chlorohydroxyquinol-1,2-dioxygenase [Actinomycetota bacterium]|nr:6-chlorohydroxyquinol-1,2-dioxygenase [Actinomycetota bacterium]